MRYCLGLMSKRLFVILYMVESLASALLYSRVGQERVEAKVDPESTCFPAVNMDHESCCPVFDPLWMVDVSGGVRSHTGQQYLRCGWTRL